MYKKMEIDAIHSLRRDTVAENGDIETRRRNETKPAEGDMEVEKAGIQEDEKGEIPTSM